MRTTAFGQSAALLLDIIEMLNKKSIPYAVIGAFAASFYGVIRASLDADALIWVEEKDLKTLIEHMHKKKLKVDYRKGDADDPIRAVVSIEDRFSNRVDLLTGISGMPIDALKRIRSTKFLGEEIKIIGREDFIAMKIFAGSPKDIEDARSVLKLKEGIKIRLLKEITASYGKTYTKKLEALEKE